MPRPSDWPTTSPPFRRRRGRHLPGVGDPPVRAGEPERGDHGPPAAHHVAAAQRMHGHPERVPKVLVAPVRSLLQRLGPHVEEADPVVVSKGDRLDHEELISGLVRWLPPRVPGRASRRDGRPGLDRRCVRVHRRCSGSYRSVGRRGRPAEPVLRGRPAVGRRSDHVELFGCRECCPTEEVRERARRWWARRPGAASSGSGWPKAWSSTAWSRGCRG